MNELVLFIIVAAILLVSQIVVRRVKKPLLNYIRITVSIMLLILVWFFSEKGNISTKCILSAILLTVLYREYMNLKKFKTS